MDVMSSQSSIPAQVPGVLSWGEAGRLVMVRNVDGSGPAFRLREGGVVSAFVRGVSGSSVSDVGRGISVRPPWPLGN
jgi:hypothetical protein